MQSNTDISRKLNIPCDRTERLHYIRRQFPQVKGFELSDDWHGGRLNALKRLNQVDTVAYGRNRNFLNGAVTRLSPYLRHGCITLKETFDNVQGRFKHSAEKLVFELAWRDYWRQVWYAQSNHILSDLEAPKVAIGYKPLPDEVKTAKTVVQRARIRRRLDPSVPRPCCTRTNASSLHCRR